MTKPTTRKRPKPATSRYTVSIPEDAGDNCNSATREYMELGMVHSVRGKRTYTIDLEAMSAVWLMCLSRMNEVSAIVKQRIADLLSRPLESILDTIVGTPTEFNRAMQMTTRQEEPFVEFQLDVRWYPVPVCCQMQHSFFTEECIVYVNAVAHNFNVRHRVYVDSATFRDAFGNKVSRSVRDVLTSLGLRFTTPERLVAFRESLTRATTMSAQYGTVIDAGRIMLPMEIGWREVLVPVSLGGDGAPKHVIVEGELERDSDRESDKPYLLPMVRVFTPDRKRFGYVDVDSITPHKWDRHAKDLIVLPTQMRRVLDAVFNTPPDRVFGDLFRNRHGGVVILAAGGSGVGKTLTSEVYAEFTGRPLYVMEMGELGTSLESVEANLQRIFDRARRWNAVLLFDEADVFLAERGDNIEKAAIVGVFLRLLDQYEGTFFLTTNRPDVIDAAFKSRITVRLDYPALSTESRAQVWRQLFAAAGLTYDGDIIGLAGVDVNGRNVRNVMRLLRILHPDPTTVTRDHVDEALQYVAR